MWVVICLMYLNEYPENGFNIGMSVGPFTSHAEADKACDALNDKYRELHWEFNVTEVCPTKILLRG